MANWIPYLSFLKWTFEALCINEFSGTTFSCDGVVTGECVSTGDQVLRRLGFGDDTVSDAVLGLSMLLIGFTVAAIVFLERSQLRFLALGHAGMKINTSKLD